MKKWSLGLGVLAMSCGALFLVSMQEKAGAEVTPEKGMVIGEVVGVHIDDAIVNDGRVDVLGYNPVARMGYTDYTTVTDIWAMERPG